MRATVVARLYGVEHYGSISGVLALVATVPVWIAVLGWILPGGRRPAARVGIGIVLGLVGVLLLIGVGSIHSGTVDPAGAIILIFSSISWSAGSLYGQKTQISDSPIQVYRGCRCWEAACSFSSPV